MQDFADFPTDADGFPIIPEDHDMMRTDTPSLPSAPRSHNEPASFPSDIPPEFLTDQAGGGGGGGGGGMVVCPHCTFENPPGNVDCEICSLPLQG